MRSTGHGYIQYVDEDGLLEFAQSCDALVRMECAVGQFVAEGAPLMSLTGVAAEDEESLTGAANRMFVIDTYRTVHQDVGFGVRQIVDIALKALSPSMNDPTTAVSCIDYLSSLLARFAARKIPSRYRRAEGRLRVIARGPQFDELLHEAFDELRGAASGSLRVQLRVLDALEQIAAAAVGSDRRAAVLRHVDLIDEVGRTMQASSDRRSLAAACARVRAAAAEFETRVCSEAF